MSILIKIIENKTLSLTDKEKKYIEKYPEKFIEEINLYFQDLSTNYSDEFLFNIVNVYHFFSDDYGVISECFHRNFYSYYIDNISKMISCRYDFGIYTLIDLFYCYPAFFPYKNNNEEFIIKTYPILFLDIDNMSSYIAIASIRFIGIIANDIKGKFYLERYLNETKDNNYEEYILEELE
ncbi:hypothetical protein [Apibacter sp. HY039]|uniref:hypothetical protein n=1 Tax=Apibacter sp. HY039 TaxID=2501476 RepID=UPI000FEBE99B|nr:hypothetical protein [Apibacter sp. HY039]